MPFIPDNKQSTSGFIPDIQKRPDFFSRVKEKVVGRGEELGEYVFKKSQEDKKGLDIRGGLRVGGALGGSISDIFVEGVKSVLGQRGTEKTKEILGKTVGRAISGVAETGIGQNIAEWAKKNPEAVQDLEDILNISAAVPITRGVVKAGEVGLRGAKAGLRTGVGVARETAEVAGKGLALTGAATEKAGQRVVSALYSQTEAQAARTLKYQAKSKMLERLGWAAKDIEKAPQILADVILKYNLSGLARGNIGARALKISNRLWNSQVKPAVSAVKEKISKKKVFDAIKKDILKTKDISHRKSLLNAFDAMIEDYKYVSSWGLKTLDKIKSDMTKRLPAKVWKGQDIAGDMNNVRLLFSIHARKIVRSKLPREILDIYDDYGSLKEIAQRGIKALSAKGFEGGVLGATSEAIKIAATPVATLGGTAIHKAGEVIKKAGQYLQK